jgi:hypothetical protein
MIKQNRTNSGTPLSISRPIEEKSSRRVVKNNVKYIVCIPRKDSWQGKSIANNEPEIGTLKLTTAGTVFDNNFFANLLQYRKYFID